MDMQSFHDQLDSYLSGAATPAETAELERSLHVDAGLRRALVDRVLLDIHLHKALAGMAAVAPVKAKPRFFRRAMIGSLVGALAAAVLLALGLSLLGVINRKPALQVPEEQPPAAPVNEIVSGNIKIDGTAVEQLPQEKWFEVAGDAPAVLRLEDGSGVELAPATRARLHGQRDGKRPAVELAQGTGKFKVTSGAGAFRVETGMGNVTVLGTEFSVKLEPRGRGESRKARNRLVLSVSVSEGSVSVDADGKNTVLRAGESRTFGRESKREDDD
jgi:ferric-dicitrate binding protein FerR (iron transport regulator)